MNTATKKNDYDVETEVCSDAPQNDAPISALFFVHRCLKF